MEFYYPSRRQDLLVGSFITTLLIGTAYWLGNGPHAIPVPHVRDSVAIDYNFKPIDPNPQVEDETVTTSKTVNTDLAPPQLLDLPRPMTPLAIPQQVEVPNPNVDNHLSKIPEGRGFSDHPGVFNASELQQQPTLVYQARPLYPSSLRQEGITGEVIVDFIVDSNGRVKNVSVAQSTNRGFEASAVEAVGKWKFRAGRKDGRAVFTHMQVPIEFSIKID